jgi:hypothetical protein
MKIIFNVQDEALDAAKITLVYSSVKPSKDEQKQLDKAVFALKQEGSIELDPEIFGDQSGQVVLGMAMAAIDQKLKEGEK